MNLAMLTIVYFAGVTGAAMGSTTVGFGVSLAIIAALWMLYMITCAVYIRDKL